MKNKLQSVVIIAGNSASGKTTLAKQLAETLSFAFLDLGSVVRSTSLEAINRSIPLTDLKIVEAFAASLSFNFSIEENRVHVEFENSIVDDTDPKLRQPFLDTDTLLLAQALRQPLRIFQRSIAKSHPVVFAARNGKAFTYEEAVKIFIDPGISTRIRRRAVSEYQQQYSQLPRDERRGLIRRVAIKERENMQLGTGMTIEQIVDERFIVVKNRSTISESLLELERITRSSLKEKM